MPSLDSLDAWLATATRKVADEPVARIRAEIGDYYHAAYETELRRGATPDGAEQSVLAALGSPKVANREYRKVFLTVAQEQMLRNMSGRQSIPANSSAACKPCATVAFALIGFVACAILVADSAIQVRTIHQFPFTIPFLIVWAVGFYVGKRLATTPSRGRWVRAIRWSFLAATAAVLLFVGNSGWSWPAGILIGDLITYQWLASIRRKLPATEWPKELYL